MQETSMKTVASRARVYTGNKTELQGNSSVPTGSFREHGEPTGNKIWITRVVSEKGRF
jgi:hypothetical protein